MKNVYIYLSFGHPSFKTGHVAIVSLPGGHERIEEYRSLAKKKVCSEIGLLEDEVALFDFMFLGENVQFVK